MRHTRASRRTALRGLRILLLGLLVLSDRIPASVAAAHAPAVEDPGSLVAQATARGTVRVLVRLDAPADPMASRTAADAAPRRAAVAIARTAMEEDLAGTAWHVTRAFRTIPYVALEVSPDALDALARSAAVLGVAADRLEKPALQDSVPLVDADLAWQAGYDGSGWTVAVLDTGVSSSHPFLAGKVVSEACYSALGDCPDGGAEQIGPGAGAPCTYARTGCLHGTHVAGVAAGRGTTFAGTAPGASVIAIQIFSRFTGADCLDDVEDPCVRAYTSDTIAALEHVYALRGAFRIAAANLSIGGGSFSSRAECDLAEGARKAAIDNLRAAGIATVAAAGNEFTPSALSAPGCISSAFSVGAVSKLDRVERFSNSAPFLDFLAPGSGILSSVPPARFAYFSGTSQATPHVAGAFAILSQRLGRADVDAVS